MLSYINEKIFGPILPLVLVFAGGFLAFKFGFKVLLRPKKIIRTLFKTNDSKSSFKAACLALSGTLGVGNIAGVAAAISAGGAGAIFWMWISAFFAMNIKYCEVVLAMYYKKDGKGGAGYYIERGLHSKKTAVLFSLLVIISSITVGNIVQSSAASEAIYSAFEIPKYVIGVIISLVTFFIACGGLKRVSNFSSIVIPFLTLGFIVLSLAIIIKNSSMLPSVFKSIFSDAFNFNSAAGGFFGFIINRSIRFGAARGILSNEAGCGTASYAHASSSSSPVEQGFWGIFEVFVDTVLLCSLTAFVVLTSLPSVSGENGMGISLRAFESAGNLGVLFIAISSAIYALASIICWSYYGCEALRYISDNKKYRRMYLVIYSAAGILGSIFAPKTVWELSDLSITLMAIINTACLCLMSGRVKCLTDEYYAKKL